MRFPPRDVFCLDVLQYSQMNGYIECQGEERAFRHVKGHLWDFKGPAHEGRGSASGGSNFSNPVGRGNRVRFFFCLRAGGVFVKCTFICHKNKRC